MPVNKLLVGRKSVSFDPIADLTEKVGQITASRSFSDEKIGQIALATESIGANEENTLVGVYNNIESSIKSIVQDFGIAVESHQLEAASIAGVFATNPRAVLASKLRAPQSGAIVVQPSILDGMVERPSIALEAYDERENRNAQLYSIVYNLMSSRQDDFSETFFPTIVINPSEVGVAISIKLFYAYNDFKRSVTGSLANFGRKNIVRAYADPDVLKNELTRAVPVLRTGGGADDNSALFAAEAGSWSVNLGNNITVTTGAVKVDTKFDLIATSQTNELLNSGLMGPTDSLDTAIKLESIYVKLTDGANTDIIRVMVDQLPGSTFTFAPQGNYRRMILTMDSDGLVLGSSTKTINGTNPAVLTEVATNKARIQLTMSGSVILDRGDCIVNRGSLTLTTLRNAGDQLVTGASFNSLAAKISNAEIIGYTIRANRANSNVRQRGLLLDSQIENRIISVLYRSPMSVLIPSISAGDDTSALQHLINTTGVRISNEAVGSLLDIQSKLAGYVPVANANGELPEIDSIGHFVAKPVYFTDSINLSASIDSLKSHERIKDIRAALVEKIRFYANEMYRNSEYQAAAAVLTGNVGFKPTVIVGTDPVLFNYIQADGDLRTLGETFDVKVVSTLDQRVAGKIFISFGVFDASRNTAINPLNFGNLLYSPETTVSLNISRDGQTSRELMVIPRFLHQPALPVMTVLNVTGLPETTGKIAVNTNAV